MNNVFITNQHQHNNNKKQILVRYFQELQIKLTKQSNESIGISIAFKVFKKDKR